MIDQCGLHESCIGQINDKIDAVKQDTDRMIIGMYGGLDKPNSGFANEISYAIKDLKTGIAEINEKVNSLAGEWQDRKKDQRAFVWGVRTAIISAIISVIGSIVLLVVGKII